ncbi:MAG: hypothetical protein DRZ80_06260, partial [Thermoprotei archaeon]
MFMLILLNITNITYPFSLLNFTENENILLSNEKKETYKIEFWTTPPDVGSITFNGVTYVNGQSGEYPVGSYSIRANVPQGYVFDHWGGSDGIRFADPNSPSTTAMVVGEEGGIIDICAFFRKSEELTAKIWVDRGCGSVYDIGDTIYVYFKVSNRAYVRIVDEFPDGSTKLLYSGWVDGGVTYYIKGVMGEPAGYRIFHIYAEDEYGNTAHDECYVSVGGKPDLVVGDVSWSPSEVIEGDVVEFRVEVRNVGNSDAGGFHAALKLGDNVVNRVWVDRLDSGESRIVYFEWKAEEAGEYTFKIIVDYDDDVEEQNERNNVKTITIEVGENNPPIAYIDSISPNPSAKGEPVTFMGHGADPDGDDIVAYEWKSSIDGFLSDEKIF